MDAVTVAATGGYAGSVQTNASGVYTISGVPHGATGIVLTPAKTGYTFAPVNRTVNNVTANVTGQDFTGTLNTYTITGTITDGVNPIDAVTVAATGGYAGSVQTNASGAYTITGVPHGATGIVLTPTKTGYTFAPVTRTVNNVTANVTGEDFTGTLNTYTISGTITDGVNP